MSRKVVNAGEAGDEDRLLRKAEVAKLLAVSTRTVERYVAEGSLASPLILKPKTLRWQWSAVSKFLESRKRRS